MQTSSSGSCNTGKKITYRLRKRTMCHNPPCTRVILQQRMHEEECFERLMRHL